MTLKIVVQRLGFRVMTLIAVAGVGSFTVNTAHGVTNRCIEVLVPADLSNPILDSRLADGAIDFTKINPQVIHDALVRGEESARLNLDALLARVQQPGFEPDEMFLFQFSTANHQFYSAYYVLHGLVGVDRNSALEELSRQASEQESNLRVAQFDPRFFPVIQQMYTHRRRWSLATRTMIENNYRAFLQQGARLEPAQRERLAVIDKRLALLSEEFAKNKQDSENQVAVRVTDAALLQGIPPVFIANAKALAETRGDSTAWLFLTTPQVYLAVLSYAESETLRRDLFLARQTVARQNHAIVIEMTNLRAERARMLGSASHMDVVTAARMAKNARQVRAFLERLQQRYQPVARREYAELERFAGKVLEPWDVSFYVRAHQEQHLQFNDEDYRPYFEYEHVLATALATVERLFGIEFVAAPNQPTWHPTVKAFHVFRGRGARRRFLGNFYHDAIARPSKRQGAWNTTFNISGVAPDRTFHVPQVLNAMSFTPPANGVGPVLLTPDNVRTVFHELGHALNNLLSRVAWADLAGTNVPWDAVEGPSQALERLMYDRSVLSALGRHHVTGAPMPLEMVERLEASRRSFVGIDGLAGVRMAALDAAYHGEHPPEVGSDLLTYEQRVLAPYQLTLNASPRVVGPTFAHLFNGGYAGGYYSYAWADVLAADVGGLLVSQPGGSPRVARRYARTVLSHGGVGNIGQRYRVFLGRPVNPEALFIEEGLLRPNAGDTNADE